MDIVGKFGARVAIEGSDEAFACITVEEPNDGDRRGEPPGYASASLDRTQLMQLFRAIGAKLAERTTADELDRHAFGLQAGELFSQAKALKEVGAVGLDEAKAMLRTVAEAAQTIDFELAGRLYENIKAWEATFKTDKKCHS